MSDLTDCFPLVFDNCKFNGEGGTRQPDGTCVPLDDCAEACSGEPGTRSEVLGVCSCSNALSIDQICNQNCRKSAPKLSYKSSYEILITTKDGVTAPFDLTQAGNVYGKLEQCRTPSGDCAIRSVEVAGDGFEGIYGLPRSV